MRYGFNKGVPPTVLTLEKSQKTSKFCSKRPQKTCKNPSFRCFFRTLCYFIVSET